MALNTICDTGIPDRIARSDTQSENRASSAQFATVACASFANSRMAIPIMTICGPWAASAAASSRMPPMLFSSPSTARLNASTRSDPLSMAAASCWRRKSSVPSIEAIRAIASAPRSPNRPRAICTSARASMIRKGSAQDQSPRAPNQIGPNSPAMMLNVGVNRADAPILLKLAM